MSNYKKEMMDLVVELHNMANDIDFSNDPDAQKKFEKRHRQAETLEFIINHPEFMQTVDFDRDD